MAGFFIVVYGTGARGYITSQLPDLVKGLGGTASQMGIVMSIAGFVSSITLLAIRPLIDRFGPRSPHCLGHWQRCVYCRKIISAKNRR
ncbi:hypothetical protein ES708_17956 [subsurface metagenome]